MKENNYSDIERTSTWRKFRKKMCNTCSAGCCTLPVEVKVKDLIRMEIIDEFDSQESGKKIAKRLKKEGIIDHFNFKNSIFTLARLANDDCIYLDSTNRQCTIYKNRPETCRNHPMIGPRPGYCPYKKK